MNLSEKIEYNRKQLEKVRPGKVDITLLKRFMKKDIDKILNSDILCTKWASMSQLISPLLPERQTGGVNLGDGRFLFHFVLSEGCESVLEIGTHIGVSTLHILAALAHSENPELVTVDIKDVNSKEGRAYEYGLKRNPRQMTEELLRGKTQFVKADSLEYMKGCNKKFDMIFLDGLHTAKRVCEEMEVAIPMLNPGGSVLLHDYYPDVKPMFDGWEPISGPCMGVKHFQKENAIKVLPLGEFPWATRSGSCFTSLAVVTR